MNHQLLRLVCEQIEVSDEGTRLLLLLTGWLCKEWRHLFRETTFIWQTWRRHCARLMPHELGPNSRHRQDLSLTTRSRCYTADINGFFRPHGGNGS